MRLAIVTTHPVQYNAPWFRLLHEQGKLECRVFYTWHDGQATVDPGFGRVISWDIPLTEGYPWELVPPSKKVQDRTFINMDSPELLARVSAFRPDAILVIGWNYRSHLSVMRYFHGKVPVLFRGDSTLLDRQSWIRGLSRSLALAWVFRNVDVALSVGTRNTEYFRQYGLQPQQVVLVPHAIDNDRFAEPHGEYQRAAERRREELGYGPHDIVVSFVGKFVPKKAPDSLITALLKAAGRRPELKLLMIGNGPMENQLRTMSSETKHIRFLPFQNQSEMPAAYRIGDITALPSRVNETWGLCLNESLASGRSVIASDKVGASVDLIRESETGYLCRNDKSLPSVLEALPDRQTLLDMGTRCKPFIKNWSFEAICEGIYRAMRLSVCPVKEGIHS